jgi:Leishmanolysin
MPDDDVIFPPEIGEVTPEPGEDGVDEVNNPAFDIVFNFTDGNTSYSASANTGAAFWELIITGDLPAVGGIDDLQVDSHLGLIGGGDDGPGGTLANAGPRNFRSGTGGLPYRGEMGIDPADVNNPAIVPIIIHELGHVIGINSGNPSRARGLVSDVGIENRWTGSNAVAEFRILSNNSSATFVRMQDDSGGQDGGHWHETVFGVELMTPSIDTSQFAPLSRMSVAALRDMGYTVDLGYADPFWLPETLAQFRDDRSGNYNTTTTVALNSSVTGSIELVEDNDWFRVSLTAGTSYTFEMNGGATGAGTLADPFLGL